MQLDEEKRKSSVTAELNVTGKDGHKRQEMTY